MFDWRKLEVFLKVYETRSFTKTARAMYLSQPTVTIHIRQLEEFLGVNLLDRDTRNVIPSKAGKIVYEYGKRILQLYREMERELSPYKEVETGLIEIGGSTIPGQYILPRVIKLFREIYPQTKIFLKVSDTAGVIEGLLRGDLELGVVGAKLKQGNLHFEACCQDEIVLIAPQDFAKEKISLRELTDLPLIKREEGSGTWITVVSHLEKRGIDPYRLKIVGEMGSTEAVKSAVKAGLGLSFVSKRAVELEVTLKLLKIVTVENFEITREFYLAYLKNKKFNSTGEMFLNFCREMFS